MIEKFFQNKKFDKTSYNLFRILISEYECDEWITINTSVMSEKLKCNQTTIRRSLSRLNSLGLLKTRHLNTRKKLFFIPTQKNMCTSGANTQDDMYTSGASTVDVHENPISNARHLCMKKSDFSSVKRPTYTQKPTKTVDNSLTCARGILSPSKDIVLKENPSFLINTVFDRRRTDFFLRQLKRRIHEYVEMRNRNSLKKISFPTRYISQVLSEIDINNPEEIRCKMEEIGVLYRREFELYKKRAAKKITKIQMELNEIEAELFFTEFEKFETLTKIERDRLILNAFEDMKRKHPEMPITIDDEIVLMEARFNFLKFNNPQWAHLFENI